MSPSDRDRAFRARINAMADPADKTIGYERAETVDIAGEIIMGSMRELSFRLFDGSHTETVPRSQVKINGDGTFTMPLWLAKKKGFV